MRTMSPGWIVCGTAHVPRPSRSPCTSSVNDVIVTGSVVPLVFCTTTAKVTSSPGSGTDTGSAVLVTTTRRRALEDVNERIVGSFEATAGRRHHVNVRGSSGSDDLTYERAAATCSSPDHPWNRASTPTVEVAEHVIDQRIDREREARVGIRDRDGEGQPGRLER